MDLTQAGWYYVDPHLQTAYREAGIVPVTVLGLGKVGFDITLFAGDVGIIFNKGKIAQGTTDLSNVLSILLFRDKPSLVSYVETLTHLRDNWDSFQSTLGQSLAMMETKGNG